MTNCELSFYNFENKLIAGKFMKWYLQMNFQSRYLEPVLVVLRLPQDWDIHDQRHLSKLRLNKLLLGQITAPPWTETVLKMSLWCTRVLKHKGGGYSSKWNVSSDSLNTRNIPTHYIFITLKSGYGAIIIPDTSELKKWNVSLLNHSFVLNEPA